jgi:tripartite-type tricarboxylate transporter receptor subunit TctC
VSTRFFAFNISPILLRFKRLTRGQFCIDGTTASLLPEADIAPCKAATNSDTLLLSYQRGVPMFREFKGSDCAFGGQAIRKSVQTLIRDLLSCRRQRKLVVITMKLPHRRQFLHLATGAAALSAFSRIATAQGYPTRPVHLIVPYAPGGTTDFTARLVGPWLSERLSQAFVIESRPGAATNIGTEFVAHASPDGYTLLLFDPSAAINATLFDKLNFDFVRDIAPIILIICTPFVIVINPSVPAMTLPEFIAYAKVRPGKINMASGGTGSASQLAGELFKVMAGIEMTHIPFRGGGPATANLLGGQVDVSFAPVSTVIQYIRADKLRALAVTGTTRFRELPDVPTAGDFVSGYDASYWIGLGAPKKTPEEIVTRLNNEINAALATPDMQAQFAQQGGIVAGGSPSDFEKFIFDETQKWANVIKTANIKPE